MYSGSSGAPGSTTLYCLICLTACRSAGESPSVITAQAPVLQKASRFSSLENADDRDKAVFSFSVTLRKTRDGETLVLLVLELWIKIASCGCLRASAAVQAHNNVLLSCLAAWKWFSIPRSRSHVSIMTEKASTIRTDRRLL